MRDKTERPEAVEAGYARLVGADEQRIVEAATLLMQGGGGLTEMAGGENPYGDGRAAERIVAALGAWQSRRSAA